MAKEILTLNAEISNGVITVSGTAENGMLAAAISVYNADGSSILFVETTSVNADGTFSYSLDTGARGTYVVSVADYDGGGTAKTATVSETTEDTPADASVGTPRTGYETAETVATATPEANASSSVSGALMFVGFLAFAAVGFTVARLVVRRRARTKAIANRED